MSSESEILNALAKYCSQAERCINDVRKKMQAENLSKEVEQRIIEQLIKEKFIDENRFSRSFVHDKFQFNRWGRIKIAYELKGRNIPSEVYYPAIETIDEDEYLTVLTELLKSKKRLVKGRTSYEIYQKLSRFASARGFETELISRTIKKLVKMNDDD